MFYVGSLLGRMTETWTATINDIQLSDKDISRHRDTVRVVIDEQGDVVKHYIYDPYGQRISVRI